MESFAINAFWLSILALPSLLFVVVNDFKSNVHTSIRALLAVYCGWALWVAYAYVAQTISSRLPEQIHGAALAFSAVFGWVIPTATVAAAWLAARVFYRRRVGP